MGHDTSDDWSSSDPVYLSPSKKRVSVVSKHKLKIIIQDLRSTIGHIETMEPEVKKELEALLLELLQVAQKCLDEANLER